MDGASVIASPQRVARKVYWATFNFPNDTK